MMSAYHCLFAIFLIFIAGCSSSTMTVDMFDGATGKSTHKVYSKYYDAGAWIAPKRVGMSVVVDHEKGRIPIASDVQQSLGALAPGDSFANGKVTIYVWNFDSQPHAVTIRRVTSGSSSFAPAGKVIHAAPHQKNGDEAGYFRIFNYSTSLPVKVEYELDGKRSSIELKLDRLTPEQLAAYFGADGKPPYPWPWFGGSDQLQ